jgi:hemin uptake protein HemP
MYDPERPRATRPDPDATIRFPAPQRRAPVAEFDRPVHDARDLTAGVSQAEILLDGTRYILRITRQGKLILTK